MQVQPVALQRRHLVDHGPDLGHRHEVAGRVELKTSMLVARVVQDRDGLRRPWPHAGSGGVDRRRQQLPKALEAVEQAVCLRGDDLHARTRHREGVALGRGDLVLRDAGHRPEGQGDVSGGGGTCHHGEYEPGGRPQVAGENLSRGGEGTAGDDDPGCVRELPRLTGAGRLLHRHGDDLSHGRRRLGAGPHLELVDRVSGGGRRGQGLHPDTGDRVLAIDHLGILVARIHHVGDRRPGLAVGVRGDLQVVLRRLGRRSPAAEHLVDRGGRGQLDLEPVLGRVVAVADRRVVRGPSVVDEDVDRVGGRVRRRGRGHALGLGGGDRTRQKGEVDALGG